MVITEERKKVRSDDDYGDDDGSGLHPLDSSLA